MSKYLPLVWAGLWRRPVRSALTVLSITIAFLLVGLLQGVNGAFAESIAVARRDLMTINVRVRGSPPMPLELIVGESARGQFAGLELGSQVRLHDGDWTIVGVFAGGGNVRESEAMADAQTVLSSYQLNVFNSATALLESTASLTTFRSALAQQPLLDAQVLREPEYLGMVSRSINRLLEIVSYAIGGIMAVGALFSVLNVIGVAIAYLVFDGRTISTLGGTRWDTQVVYALTITPAVLVIAVTLACTVGLLGGLSPALKAARASVADSLRAT